MTFSYALALIRSCKVDLKSFGELGKKKKERKLTVEGDPERGGEG